MGDLTEIALVLRMLPEILEERVVASPYIVGSELATSIAEYARKQSLGYYPALDYFESLDILDQDLVDALHGITWFVTDTIRRELPAMLRDVGSISIEGVHPVALSMPTARPGHANALHELERHFTPDQVRVVLQLEKPKAAGESEYHSALLESRIADSVHPIFELVELHDITPGPHA